MIFIDELNDNNETGLYDLKESLSNLIDSKDKRRHYLKSQDLKLETTTPNSAADIKLKSIFFIHVLYLTFYLSLI